jgi:hypothetical protein
MTATSHMRALVSACGAHRRHLDYDDIERFAHERGLRPCYPAEYQGMPGLHVEFADDEMPPDRRVIGCLNVRYLPDANWPGGERHEVSGFVELPPDY